MSTIKIFFLTFILLLAQVAFALSNDEYLKQLEAEADEEVIESQDFIESQQSGAASALDAPSTGTELILDKKVLITDQISFEKALEASYKESYALYMELSDQQKKLIYDDFTQTKRLYNSSVKIISVYLSSH